PRPRHGATARADLGGRGPRIPAGPRGLRLDAPTTGAPHARHTDRLPSEAMTTRSLRVWAPLLAAALLATLAAVAWPSPARADLGDDAESRPVVLIGAPGLAWSD